MAFDWHDWEFTRQADEPLPAHWQTKWWMDRRHTEFLYALLLTGRFRRVLEIGCHHGSSTAALVQAVNDGAPVELHLCDPDDSPVLRQVVARCTQPIVRHLCCSLRVLPQRSWDLVIVDGDHTLPHVSKELALLLLHEVPAIVAHDVEYRGHDGCAGACYLGDALRCHPAYHCVVDAERRAGEYTHRGLLLACRDVADLEAARPAWVACCSN